MMKYYVIQTKGNTENIVKVFSNEKEAKEYGKEYFSRLNPGDGVITVEGIADGNANRKIVAGWHH